MALTKMGGVTTAASGKMNGIVYSHNRNGTYVRTFAVPTNPRSPKQTAVRQQLANHAAEYRALATAQQTDWTNLGSQLTRTNRVGDVYTLTGSQAYVSVNQLRGTAGQPPVSDAPSPDALANITSAQIEFIGDDTQADVVATVTPIIAGVLMGKQLRIFGAPPLSAGKRFIRPTQYRLLTTVAAVTGTAIQIKAAYQNTFGNLSASKVGALVSIKIVPYDPEGFAGTELRVDTIVEAAP